MKDYLKISIGIPSIAEDEGRYFSIRLKNKLVNERPVYSHPSKVLALSDIEGNFEVLCKLLIKNKVINKYFEWIYDKGHLVIVGDCFDRGEQVVECLWLIYTLEERARRGGGYVHFILGNHEIMNLNGDWRYIHPKYAEKTKYQRPLTAIYDGNSELWRWLCTKNIIEKIGDVIYVHGGISEELLKLNISIEDINRKARLYYTQANNQFRDPLLSLVFNSDNSPFWYRGYYQNNINEQLIDSALDHFKVKAIVTGHTVVSKVTSYFNGKVINVNTNHAAGNSEALLINKGRYYRVNTEGRRKKIT
jgi:hypothetical protein